MSGGGGRFPQVELICTDRSFNTIDLYMHYDGMDDIYELPFIKQAMEDGWVCFIIHEKTFSTLDYSFYSKF